jgi:mercuric ion transport protein
VNQVVTASQKPKSRFAAAGSLVAAVLASSCCIGPLLLVTLGVSGAWIGNLTALVPSRTTWSKPYCG